MLKNREIEVRVQVEDSAPLVDFLAKNGQLVSEEHQRDEYFSPAHRNFLDKKPVAEWLRLRSENGKHSMTYKNWHTQENGESYYCDEYETSLGDIDQINKIFEALNMSSLIVVNKKRKVFAYKDYEIALDSVEDLGEYVEVEHKGECEESEIPRIAEEMKNFIEDLGCKILTRDFEGYPLLLLKKKYERK